MPLFLCAYFIQCYSHKQITLGTFNLHVLCFYRQFKQFHYEDVEGLNVNFSKKVLLLCHKHNFMHTCAGPEETRVWTPP